MRSLPPQVRLMHDLAEKAIISTVVGTHRHRKYVPGEFLAKHTTPEEKELIKSLESKDLADVNMTHLAAIPSSDSRRSIHKVPF
jgi:hypothetical protein